MSIIVNGFNDIQRQQSATSGSVSLEYERTFSGLTVKARGLTYFGGFTAFAESQNPGTSSEAGPGVAQGNMDDLLTITAPGRAGQTGVLTFKLITTGTLFATTERPGGVGGDMTERPFHCPRAPTSRRRKLLTSKG